MNITFISRGLARQFGSEGMLVKTYGQATAKRIMSRMAVLNAVSNLSDLPTDLPTRRHKLGGRRRNQFAVDVSPNMRLVFTPNHDPMPTRKDGGLDLASITDITILEVTDYH
jgi:plasmid maintenance system killer protein